MMNMRDGEMVRLSTLFMVTSSVVPVGRPPDIVVIGNTPMRGPKPVALL